MLCKECKIERDVSEFYKHPQTKDWIIHICKDCKKKYAKANRISNEDERKRYRSKPRRRLQTIFSWIMSRCYDENNHHYKRYWWKWIVVLRKNFDEFYKDMIEEYTRHREQNWKTKNRQTQIDRIDNNWNYSKENCRRVNAKENSNNRF